MKKTALITGVTGQTGYYLAKHLLALGYDVHGLVRRSSQTSKRLIELRVLSKKFHVHHGDLSDGSSIARVLAAAKFDEIYNLAAQTHVGVSFDCPEYTADVNGTGVLRLLEALRHTQSTARLYQASTSEMFGNARSPQTIDTPFAPRSPYAAAKVFAHTMVGLYRDAYGLYACCGVLFNHESPERGDDFVTQKIVNGLCDYKNDRHAGTLKLGNLESRRDWGDAREYVVAIHGMLQQSMPRDRVVCTGVSTSVKEFVDLVAHRLGLDLVWHGFPLRAFDAVTGHVVIDSDPALYRPADVDDLRGDPGDTFEILEWRPSTTLDTLAADMVEARLASYADV